MPSSWPSAGVRRRFYELAAAGPAPIASEALERIAALYRIETDIRSMTADQRRRILQDKSRPITEALKPWLTDKLSLISQKTKLAEAIRYALSRWEGLTRFIDDGRIEIDSNIVERSIRPIALNRKNALFAGSDGGGEHWAVIASLIETAKLNAVDPQAYLADVLTRIVNGHPQACIDDLLPWAYAATSPKAVARKQRLFFAQLPPAMIGMEACATSHYWARELSALGHSVKLMPPHYVKPYVKRQKNDMADAAAICEAVTRPSMRFVPVKSEEQQAVLMLHRSRELLVRQHTMLVNALRAYLAELGIVMKQGKAGAAAVAALVEDAEISTLSSELREALLPLVEQLRHTEERSACLEHHCDVADCRFVAIAAIAARLQL